MILPVGTKVQVVEGDTVRKKGSLGYASAFLPMFGSPCADARQLVVFTRLGKKGKSRLEVMPVPCKVLDHEDIVPEEDEDLFNKIAIRDGMKARQVNKITKFRPSIDTEVEAIKSNKTPIDLTEWHWIDFFARVIAELFFLSTIHTYYQSATTAGPYRITQDAVMVLEGLKIGGNGIPAPAQRGGLMDLIKTGSSLRAARTLLQSIDNDSEYNLDYMGTEFRDVRSRRRIMGYLKRLYAMNTPAIRFYDAYILYYQAIASDFTKFALKHYKNNKKSREQIERMYREHSNSLNSRNDGLFTAFAMNVGEQALEHGRHTCKYVNMLPEEVASAELVTNNPMVRHRLFGRGRVPEGAPGQLRGRGLVRPVDAPEAEPVFGEPEPEAPRPRRPRRMAPRRRPQDHPNEAEMAEMVRDPAPGFADPEDF